MQRKGKLEKVSLALMLVALVMTVAYLPVREFEERAHVQERMARQMPVVEAEAVSLTSVNLDEKAGRMEVYDLESGWSKMAVKWKVEDGVGMSVKSPGEWDPIGDILHTSNSISIAQYQEGGKMIHDCVFFLPYVASDVKLERVTARIYEAYDKDGSNKPVLSNPFGDYAEYLRDGYFLMPDAHLVQTDIMEQTEELRKVNPQDNGVVVFMKWEVQRQSEMDFSNWEQLREAGEFRLQCLEEGVDIVNDPEASTLCSRLLWIETRMIVVVLICIFGTGICELVGLFGHIRSWIAERRSMNPS